LGNGIAYVGVGILIYFCDDHDGLGGHDRLIFYVCNYYQAWIVFIPSV
jgi:hypothetical protein